MSQNGQSARVGTIVEIKGVVVDAGSAKLELTGGEVAIKATRGVTLDGGAGPVKVSSSSQLDLKGGALASLSAGLVKIN